MIPRYRAWNKSTKVMYEDGDRIMLEYRTKGEVGRNKIAVKKALYKAYALGV